MPAVAFSALRLDAHDVERVAGFWAEVLGWERRPRPDGSVVVAPGSGAGYPVVVGAAHTPKAGQNRIHLDLTTDSAAAQEELVRRVLALGGSHADVGQAGDEGHVVLADPEGNELCVIEPRNAFLAGTGTVGAVNCDGSQAVGYFWSAVLGWPLVWDQDEETAIQSPAGGSKITWSGPPLLPRLGRDRWRFELRALDDLAGAVADLVAAGATVIDALAADRAVLLDPDGNE